MFKIDEGMVMEMTLTYNGLGDFNIINALIDRNKTIIDLLEKNFDVNLVAFKGYRKVKAILTVVYSTKDNQYFCFDIVNIINCGTRIKLWLSNNRLEIKLPIIEVVGDNGQGKAITKMASKACTKGNKTI